GDSEFQLQRGRGRADGFAILYGSRRRGALVYQWQACWRGARETLWICVFRRPRHREELRFASQRCLPGTLPLYRHDGQGRGRSLLKAWRSASMSGHHFHLLAKPSGAACNLSCKYCFFLSKENLYRGESHLMDEATLRTYIRQLMESSPGPEVHVAWQGGEPMLRGLDFFRSAVRFAEEYRRPDQRVIHTIQTNGTLIDDEWAAFFEQNRYLVGISIDGPRALHDV